jgi:hypothetical protein
MDKIRVLRVIEYIGDREWVEKTLEKSIHGTWKLPNNREIRVATIGDFAEIIQQEETHEGIPHNGGFYESDNNT